MPAYNWRFGYNGGITPARTFVNRHFETATKFDDKDYKTFCN